MRPVELQLFGFKGGGGGVWNDVLANTGASSGQQVVVVYFVCVIRE
jgi:hypothetical protein